MECREFNKILNEHFTPSAPAINNYMNRKDLDKRFLTALYEKGLQIIVYGPTGVGKSSLVWSMLEKEKLTYLRFPFDTMINENNFCQKVMHELGFEKIMQQKDTKENGDEAEIAAGASIWKLIDFKGRFKAHSKNAKENTVIPYYNEADIDAVSKALQLTNCILFLDDVEKANDALRKIIAHLGKKLSDSSVISGSNAKIIYVGISQEVNKLIEIDSSLRDRLSDQLVLAAKDEEIKNILTTGWDKLKLRWNSNELKNIVSLCCGYPRYAHWIGKLSAKNAFENGRNNIIRVDFDEAIKYIIEYYRDAYQTKFDKATGHKTGLHLRENILYAIASSDDIEVRIDYILKKCSELVGANLAQSQISGPLGELKKERRGMIVEDGRVNGSHRFKDLMLKPYIRMLMNQKNLI
ncbi:ATP-binding protein [Clostridium autoethanogenum]|nr:ATP-binding protein [Clostridium autoethanogenum]